MTSHLRKYLKIVYERLKVPRRLVRSTLHVARLYKRGRQNAHDLLLQRFTIDFVDLPPAFDGYRLLVMSDLHIDSELDIVPRAKTILDSTSADILLLLGDYRYRISGSDDLVRERLSDITESAHVRDGMYAVRGNHDSKAMMRKFPDFGVSVLNNESIQITRNGSSIHILGVDEPHYDKDDDLPLAMRTVPKNAFKILLAHTSEIYREAASLGIDLYLCGHTHGGQICLKKIGPIITNVSSPRQFARGFWSFKNMTGYTTTGVGISAVPVRFNCPPEIVLFTLKVSPDAH